MTCSNKPKLSLTLLKILRQVKVDERVHQSVGNTMPNTDYKCISSLDAPNLNI